MVPRFPAGTQAERGGRLLLPVPQNDSQQASLPQSKERYGHGRPACQRCGRRIGGTPLEMASDHLKGTIRGDGAKREGGEGDGR